MRALPLLVCLGCTGLTVAAEEPRFAPRRVAFAPDGKSLAVGGPLGKAYEVRLLDLATHKPLYRIPLAAGVTGFAWTADGQTLFIAAGATVSRLDARTGKEQSQLGPHGKGVLALALSPDEKVLATGGEDRSVRLWEVARSKQIKELTGHKGGVGSVAISPDGKRLLTSGAPDVRLWDLESGKLLRTLLSNRRYAESALFADGGRMVLAGGNDGRVRLLDSATGESRGQIGGMGGVFALRYHEASHTLVWASWSEVGLFDVHFAEPDGKTKKKIVNILRCLDDDRYDVRENASKEMMALGWVVTSELRRAAKESPSAEVRIRARAIVTEVSETPRIVLRGHRGNVRDVAISPDGKMLASAGDDGTVRLWDVGSGKEKATLVGAMDRPGKQGTK